LTADERERGVAFGRALQRARGQRGAAEVALRAGISLDTLRKIERGCDRHAGVLHGGRRRCAAATG
jgi:hypothetical protein